MVKNNVFQLIENRYYDVDDIDEMLEECFTYKTTLCKGHEVFEDILAFDIETSSFTYNETECHQFEDSTVFSYINGITLHYDEHIKSDIPDFDILKMHHKRYIKLKSNGGYPIDSFYMELCALFPYYFNEDITHPSDQLLKIFEVFDMVSPVKAEAAEKAAVMYVWQLCINGRTVIGRTWSEFLYVLDKIGSKFLLSKDRRMVIYVHNLAFEFEFMYTYFTWINVFATAPRKPIYALTDTGFEFRCSYILSNYSLQTLANNLHTYDIKKLVGDLDYRLIRTSDTLLLPNEINYCINDVLIVSAYIKELIDDMGTITKIPYTCTGFCRNFVRKQCLSAKGYENQRQQFKKYHRIMNSLTLDVDEFAQLQRAFMGGFTHCSAPKSGKKLEYVDSFDETSAYPAALVSNLYPMSKAEVITINSRDEFEENLKYYCCVFDCRFTDLLPKVINENYIPKSKCWNVKNPVVNNGRVVSADELCITITSVDFDIIRKTYTWSGLKIGTFRRYRMGYLPKEIIMSILTLYKDKTELKGVKGKEVEYQRAKGLLNSIY